MRASFGLWIWIASLTLIHAGGCAESDTEPVDETDTRTFAEGVAIDACEEYQPGVAYGPGDSVVNDGNVYTCRPWPFSGWCGAGAAYEPGVGWAWEMAWTLGGECDGGGGGGGGGGGDDLEWRAANLTWFTSYPDPDSDECEDYNGCMWAGYFAFVDGRQSEQWVASHNIVAVHSRDAGEYALKTLRIRQGSRAIDATVYDMCSDSDCDGCCTRNASETGFLLDLESYTMERFGSSYGIVEWACLDCD